MSFIEKTFLGTLIKGEHLLNDTIIRPKQLECTLHQDLLKKFIELKRKGMNIDLVSLTTLPDLKSFGGMSTLSELASFADVNHFDRTEKLILEQWKEREKRNILTIAKMNDWDIAKVMDELDKINLAKMDDHTSIEEAMAEVVEAPWADQPLRKSTTTGIKKLDEVTGGFQDGEVTILAARPSMGKTDVMLHFAKMAGWAGFLPLVFSLEMPKKLLRDRLVASTGGFNRAKMVDPKSLLTEKQKEKWPDVIGQVCKTHIQIFDGAEQTIAEMRAKTRKMIHKNPTMKPILFIDYLTLIHSSQMYSGNSHMQVTEISKSLKTLAKDFDCPVVCLAQLNRSVETRINKRPLMSDIRESGSVEQDADVILFLYREAYYDRETQDRSLEIIVSKNRNGPVGTVTVNYNQHTGKVDD